MDYIKRLLRYDPETGLIYWKTNHNNVKKGQLTYTKLRKRGYLIINIKKKDFLVHRIAFLLMTGEWPKLLVDHINGDKTDNRFCNLRLATNAQNIQNSKLSVKNISGFKGVCWNNVCKKWSAYITSNGQSYNLGLYLKIEDAIQARIEAEEKFHGEFSSYKNRVNK